MPVSECPIHGWTSNFNHVCPHIAEDVGAPRTVRHFNTYFVSMEGVPDIRYFTITHFCDDCVKSRDLPDPKIIIPEELWDHSDERRWGNTALICSACFKQNSLQEIPSDRFAV